MAFDTGISSAVAQYVYTQSNGAVTEPIGGSYLQAYCEFLGVTEPLNNSWLIALCDYFGITEPLNGSWTIALANYYGIVYPTGGTWWMALANTPYINPTPPFIWNEDTNNWEAEARIWNIGTPVVPTADFTSNVTTIFVGETVEFTDTSAGYPTSWNWTFQSGTPLTSTLQNPVVQFNTAGQFSVSLEAINAEGSNVKTVTDYMTVNILPVVADFSANNTTPIEGGTVAFTDLSTGTPTEWSWTLPGATPDASVAQNPSVVYSTAGTYSVSLTASKVGSTDTEIKTDYITVQPASVTKTLDSFAFTVSGYGPVSNATMIDSFDFYVSGYGKNITI
jgi:PKD repeat protein